CFFFQAEDGIRDKLVTGVQTCALPIFRRQFEWVYNLNEEFGSHALAHYDHGGHPGRIAAEGDRRLESDRGRLETVSGSQPGRLRSEERRVGKECRGGWGEAG